ncbi:aromatic-ring-hydroxylating dioxygenase subunit beta [Blastococcus sp. SYSU D00820]
MTAAAAERLRIGSPEYAEAVEFLFEEARLLDAYDYRGWLQVLHPDIDYRMPVRITRMPKDGPGFVDGMEFFSENHSSLRTRVERLQTEQAWAEQPGSRARHFVSNTLVDRLPDGDLSLTSAFLVTRVRADSPYDIFTGTRQDVLRRGEDGRLLLVKRLIHFDQTVLQAMNLSIFF